MKKNNQYEIFSNAWIVNDFLISFLIKKLFGATKKIQKSVIFKSTFHRQNIRVSTEDTSEKKNNNPFDRLSTSSISESNREISSTFEKNPAALEKFFQRKNSSALTQDENRNHPKSKKRIETIQIKTNNQQKNTLLSEKVEKFNEKILNRFNNSTKKELRRFFLRKNPLIFINTSEILNLIEKNLDPKFPSHVKRFLFIIVDFFKKNLRIKNPASFFAIIKLPGTFPVGVKKIDKKKNLSNPSNQMLSSPNVALSIISKISAISLPSIDVLSFVIIPQAFSSARALFKKTDPPLNHSRDQTHQNRKNFFFHFVTSFTNILTFSNFDFFINFFSSSLSFQSISFNRALWPSRRRHPQRFYFTFFSFSNFTLAAQSWLSPTWPDGSRVKELRDFSKSQNLRLKDKGKKKTTTEILISDQNSSNSNHFESNFSDSSSAHQDFAEPNIMKNNGDVSNTSHFGSNSRSARMTREEMRQKMRDLIIAMFEAFAKNIRNRASQMITASSENQFKASDVDFFDLKFDESYGPGDVVQIERNTYYKNVYLFVKRIRDIVIIMKGEKIKINLFNCLRGVVQIWYTKNLSNLKKNALRFLNEGAEKWCEILIQKFKKSISSALQTFIIEKYILNDVRAQRNISSFVFQIMKHVKNANINDLHEQLTWTYNVIASKFVRDVNSPNAFITITEFISKLKNKKKIWYRIYFRKYNFNRSGAETEDQQNSNYFRRSDYQETYNRPQQNTSYLFPPQSRRLLSAAEGNVSKKNSSNQIQQNAGKNNKDKTPMAIFS